MDTLEQTIADLSKDEVRFFKIYASRFDSDEERKDLVLFNSIRVEKQGFDANRVLKKLGYSTNKNAYYRLRNRLIRDVQTGLHIQHLENDEILRVYHFLALANIYQTKANFDLALHMLEKAEKIALKLELNEHLEIIYSEFIKLSTEITSIDPEEYITKRKENAQVVSELRELDDILAVVKYRLRRTQNFGQDSEKVLSILATVTEEFSSKSPVKQSGKLQFMLYNAVSQVLLQRQEFKALEEYLLSTYNQFNTASLFTKNNHDQKLRMLTYMINTLFKNGKHKLSLQYAQQLHEEMKAFGSILYDKYKFYYDNSLVINYSILDINRAIEILLELESSKSLLKSTYYQTFVYLNLATLQYEAGDLSGSIKSFNKLYQSDGFSEADRDLSFRIELAELCVRFDNHDPDYFDYRVSRFEKDYEDVLKEKSSIPEKMFVDLLKQMIVAASPEEKEKIKSDLQEFEELYSNKVKKEEEIIDLRRWVRTRTEQL